MEAIQIAGKNTVSRWTLNKWTVYKSAWVRVIIWVELPCIPPCCCNLILCLLWCCTHPVPAYCGLVASLINLLYTAPLTYLTRREEERAIVWLLCWCSGVHTRTQPLCTHAQTLGSERVACKASSSHKLQVSNLLCNRSPRWLKLKWVKSALLTAAWLYILISLRSRR